MNIPINNDQEEAAFLEVLDLATKAGGVRIAATTATLYQRYAEAKKAEQPLPEPVTTEDD